MPNTTTTMAFAFRLGWEAIRFPWSEREARLARWAAQNLMLSRVRVDDG